MVSLFIDHDVTDVIVQGVKDHFPEVDLVRTREVSLAEADDSTLLDWADAHQRVMVSSDANTMTAAAYQRLRAGMHMAGLVIIPQSLEFRTAIEDLAAIALCSELAEWENKVIYLPLVKQLSSS